MKAGRVSVTEKRITPVGLAASGIGVIPAGTPLIAMYASVGKTAITDVPVAINQAILAVHPGKRSDSRFLVYLLESSSPEAVRSANTNTQANLNAELVRNLQVPQVPIHEQRAIAAFLDRETARIDALVAAKERQIVCLDQKAMAEREELVRKGRLTGGNLVSTGLDWRGPAPPEWNQIRLKQVLRQISRPVEMEPDARYTEIGIRSHGRGIFHKESARGEWLGDKKVFWVQPGCLVFNIVFAWEGAVAVTGKREAGMIASHRFPMFEPVRGECDVGYLKHLLTSGVGLPLLAFHSPGAAGRNKTLALSRLMEESVPLPSVKEQTRIAEAVEGRTRALSHVKKRLLTSVQTLKERRQALITHAVTGDLKMPMEAIHA